MADMSVIGARGRPDSASRPYGRRGAPSEVFAVGRPGFGGARAGGYDTEPRPADPEGLLRDAIELHAEVQALRELFEDAAFLAWALHRALAGHPDLRLLARHIHEQLPRSEGSPGVTPPPGSLFSRDVRGAS